MNKLIGPELVRIEAMCGRRVGRLDPIPEIGTARALPGWTNSVAPVVAVGETTAGEANDRRLDLAHVFHKFASDAVVVGNLGILTHPDTVVDDAAEVLCEMAVDIWRDGAQLFGEQNLNTASRACGRSQRRYRAAEQQQAAGCQSSLAQKLTTFHHGDTFPTGINSGPL